MGLLLQNFTLGHDIMEAIKEARSSSACGVPGQIGGKRQSGSGQVSWVGEQHKEGLLGGHKWSEQSASIGARGQRPWALPQPRETADGNFEHSLKIKVLAINVCGLKSKLNNGICESYIQGFDIICLSEAKLNPHIDDVYLYKASRWSKKIGRKLTLRMGI